MLAFVLGSGGAKTDRAGAERRLEMALDLYRAQDYAGAREALSALADDPSAGSVGRRAERYLKRTTAAIAAAQEELGRYEERALDFDLGALDTTREVFLRQHGSAFTDEFDAVVAKVRDLQTAWVGEQVGKVQAEVTPFLESGNYAKARSLWQPLLERRHLGVGLGDQVAEALAVIDTKAVADATAILAAAEKAEETAGPAIALRKVRARLSNFQGTSAYASLVDAIEGYERAVREAAVAAQVPTPPTETPVAPPTEPTPNATSREAATALLASAAEAAQAWKFVLAAQVLADAKPTAVRLLVADRAADLALAADGHAALVADIEANEARYRGIGGGGRTKISLIGADEDTVLARVPGGQRKDRWASMSPSRVAEITGRFRATGAAALGLAALLREVGLPEPVDALLVAAGEGGVETDRLFPLIARWRDETVPAAGYVVHEDRYVSPEEREHLVLLAKIAEEAKEVRSKDERTWKEAAEKLLLLGPEARPALRDALMAKRTDVIGDLAKLERVHVGQDEEQALLRAREAPSPRAGPHPQPGCLALPEPVGPEHRRGREARRCRARDLGAAVRRHRPVERRREGEAQARQRGRRVHRARRSDLLADARRGAGCGELPGRHADVDPRREGPQHTGVLAEGPRFQREGPHDGHARGEELRPRSERVPDDDGPLGRQDQRAPHARRPRPLATTCARTTTSRTTCPRERVRTTRTALPGTALAPRGTAEGSARTSHAGRGAVATRSGPGSSPPATTAT